MFREPSDSDLIAPGTQANGPPMKAARILCRPRLSAPIGKAAKDAALVAMAATANGPDIGSRPGDQSSRRQQERGKDGGDARHFRRLDRRILGVGRELFGCGFRVGCNPGGLVTDRQRPGDCGVDPGHGLRLGGPGSIDNGTDKVGALRVADGPRQHHIAKEQVLVLPNGGGSRRPQFSRLATFRRPFSSC